MMQFDYDLIIIGSGPGGYVAAIRASQLGLKVACVEKEQTLGGTCLNIGCIPSKSLLHSSQKFYEIKNFSKDHGIIADNVNLNIKQMMQRKEKIVKQLTNGISFLFKKNKINVFTGTGSFYDNNTVLISGKDNQKKISAKNIIIASGSITTEIPSFNIDEKNILSSTGALSLEKIPKKLLVVGGGYIGLEMGSVWNRLGTEVTVVETMERIVPLSDNEISSHFLKSLKNQGLKFILAHKVTKLSNKNNEILAEIESIKDGKKISENFDKALISVGRKPYTKNLSLDKIGLKTLSDGSIKINENYQTNVKNIFVIGDVVSGPMLAHKAEEEGIICVEKITGQKPSLDYDIIPSIIYTNPEIASVGKTEEDLKKDNIKYKIGKFPFMANGRALTTSSSEGFVKILAESNTDKILGCHIIGHEAGNLISEIVSVMEFGGSSEDVARICHAHPTTSEAVKEAALNVDGRSIHI